MHSRDVQSVRKVDASGARTVQARKAENQVKYALLFCQYI